MLECKSLHSEKEKPNSQFKILLNRKNNRDAGTISFEVRFLSKEPGYYNEKLLLKVYLKYQGMVTNIVTVKMGLCTVKMQEHYLLFHAIFSTINTAKL